jgi:hypothetical protein
LLEESKSARASMEKRPDSLNSKQFCRRHLIYSATRFNLIRQVNFISRECVCVCVCSVVYVCVCVVCMCVLEGEQTRQLSGVVCVTNKQTWCGVCVCVCRPARKHAPQKKAPHEEEENQYPPLEEEGKGANLEHRTIGCLVFCVLVLV